MKLLGLALLVLVAAAVLPPASAAAQPSITATVPARVAIDVFALVIRGQTVTVPLLLTLERKMLYSLSLTGVNDYTGEVTVYVDGKTLTSMPVPLEKGTHNITIAVTNTQVNVLNLRMRHTLAFNMSFTWTVKLDEDNQLVLDLPVKHGVTVGAPKPLYAPTHFEVTVDLMNPVRAVTADKGMWRAEGTAVTGFSETPFDDAKVKVFLAPPAVSRHAVRVVDNWGQEALLPSDYSRLLVGSQFTAQPKFKDVTVLHFVNGTQAPAFRFDKHAVYKCALLTYKVVSSRGITYPVFNLTSFEVKPKKLSVEYSTWSTEELPFTLKLSGDLSKVGSYSLVFEARGTTLGVLTGTERVHVDGSVSTVGTYTVEEDAEWYNVSITYPVATYTLTHPHVQKVYSLEPITISEDKSYLTVTTGKPLVVKGQRKVVRATSDVGDAPLSSAGDLSFVGITRSSTWTVKLATRVTVSNVLESGKPVSATVRVLDTKGNVVAQASGATVTFELEPLVNYVVTSDTGVERASRFVYLTDDAQITFTFTKEPPAEIPTDLVTTAALLVVAVAAVYIAWRLTRGGLALEISA